MLFQHAGNGIGAGEDRLAALPGDRWTADAAQLLDHLGYIHSRTQRQGDQAADSFQLGDGAGTGLAERRKDLENSLVVVSNGDIKRAAAGVDLGNRPFSLRGSLARSAVGVFL